MVESEGNWDWTYRSYLLSPLPRMPLLHPLANLTCRAEPDLEFEGLLKRQHTRVKYFQGSLMNAMDLERAKVAATPKKRKHKTHLVIVSHPRDAFLDRRPSASKAPPAKLNLASNF